MPIDESKLREAESITKKSFKEQHCEFCGDNYLSARKGTRFCSNSCKQLAYNARRDLSNPQNPKSHVNPGNRGQQEKEDEAKLDATMKKARAYLDERKKNGANQ